MICIIYGVHTTHSNEFDGYLGSGYKLRRFISKYGENHFKRETLFEFDSWDEACAKERELVNEELLKDPNCLNIAYGGGCGWRLINEERKLGLRQHPLKGKHRSQEVKDKISKNHQPCAGDNNANYKAKHCRQCYTDGLTNIYIGDGLRSFYIPNNFVEGKSTNKKGHQIKILIVPDIHSKKYILDKFIDLILVNGRFVYDKVIFLGDYIDGFVESNEDMLYCLNTVINLKKKYMDKVVLLLANHEMSYLGYPCSGHRFEIEDIVTRMLKENINLFNFCYAINDFVFSHAGITNSWLNGFKFDIDKISKRYWDVNAEIQRIVNMINNNILDVSIPGYYRSRGLCNTSGSCVWADKKELITDYIPYFSQIVGHTPVNTVEIYNKSKGVNTSKQIKIVFTDTFSTYRDGTIYGDLSYIEYYPSTANKSKQISIKYL